MPIARPVKLRFEPKDRSLHRVTTCHDCGAVEEPFPSSQEGCWCPSRGEVEGLVTSKNCPALRPLQGDQRG